MILYVLYYVPPRDTSMLSECHSLVRVARDVVTGYKIELSFELLSCQMDQ